MRRLLFIVMLAGCGTPNETPPPATADVPVSVDDVGNDTSTTPTSTIPPLAKGSETDPLSRTASLAVAGLPMSPGALAVAGNGRLAYCDGNRVSVVSADDLKPTSAINTLPGACLAVAFDGPEGYASSVGGKWELVVAEGTTEPVFYDGPESRALALTRERIYAAAGTQGIASALRDQAKATVYGVARDSRDLLVSGADLIVADGQNGILRMALAPDGTPSVKASVEPSDIDWAVAPLDDTHILAARGAAGIAIVDTSNDGLKVTATYDTTVMATDVAAGPDHLVMVADWAAARLVDFTNPDAPALLAREAFPRSAGGLGRALGVVYAGGAFTVLGLDHLTRLTANPHLKTPELEVLRDQVLIEALKCDGTKPDCEDKGSAGVLVRNRGSATLNVTKIVVSDPRLALSIDPSAVPGVDVPITPEDQAGFFEVVATGTTPLDAKLTFETNDPDHAKVELPVRVNPPLLKVGDKAPDFLFPGIDGAAYQLSALGGKVLFMKVFNAL